MVDTPRWIFPVTMLDKCAALFYTDVVNKTIKCGMERREGRYGEDYTDDGKRIGFNKRTV